jgi:hypothetical protein
VTGPPSQPDREALARLAKLQQWRGPRRPPAEIAALVEPIGHSARRTERRIGNVVDIWLAFVPPELAQQTIISGFRAGTLHVTAASAAVRFELDRQLREGLLGQMRRAFPGTLSQVRISAGPIDAPGTGARCDGAR